MTTLQALAQNGEMLALLTVVAVGLAVLIVVIARRLTRSPLPARDEAMELSAWDRSDEPSRNAAPGTGAPSSRSASKPDRARA